MIVYRPGLKPIYTDGDAPPAAAENIKALPSPEEAMRLAEARHGLQPQHKTEIIENAAPQPLVDTHAEPTLAANTPEAGETLSAPVEPTHADPLVA